MSIDGQTRLSYSRHISTHIVSLDFFGAKKTGASLFDIMFAARHTHILTPYIPLPHTYSHTLHTMSTHIVSCPIYVSTHIFSRPIDVASNIWRHVCRATHAYSHTLHTASAHMISHYTYHFHTQIFTHYSCGAIFLKSRLLRDAHITSQSTCHFHRHISHALYILPHTYSRTLQLWRKFFADLFAVRHTHIVNTQHTASTDMISRPVHISTLIFSHPTVVAQKVWSHVCCAPKARRKGNAALHLSAASQRSGV